MKRLSAVLAGVAVVVLTACALSPSASTQPAPSSAPPPNLALTDSDILWRTGLYAMGDGSSSGGGDVGETGFYLRFRVRNDGAARTSRCAWEVTVKRDDEWREIARGRIRALDPGEWAEVVRILRVQAGEYVRVRVDAGDEVPETHENDNLHQLLVPRPR